MAKKPLKELQLDYAKTLDILAECESVRDACKKTGVTVNSFLHWTTVGGDERNAQYTRAREAMIANYAANTELIFDQNPERITVDAKIDPAWVQMQRAKAEFRRWHLSKLAPKQYGEKIELSGDAKAPLVTRVDIVSVACTPQK
jgi:hypothetical protein